MKRFFLTLAALFCAAWSWAASASDTLTFAYISDTHVGSGSGATDLEACVADMNTLPEIRFVIHAGDVTEFGADSELELTKSIMDHLKMPYYIVPGNHDVKWSESGGNTFNRLWGGSVFTFDAGGIRFIGTDSGPNMRMGMAQVPRESLVWMDSLVRATPKDMPIVYITHNPVEKSLSNWDHVYDILKQGNLVLTMGGHWHSNNFKTYDGIPAVIGRSSLASTPKFGGAGYNLVRIDTRTGDVAIYNRQASGTTAEKPWCTFNLFTTADRSVPQSRPDYSINQQYPNVEVVWQFQDKADIGAGFATDGRRIFYATAPGVIKAVEAKSGKPVWEFPTGGRIYSFPYYADGRVVCASTDGNVYCLDAKKGKELWRYRTEKGIVACPLVHQDAVYIGSSCGKFYAIDLRTGREKWTYEGIKGFIEARPCADDRKVYIGSWGNEFYAFDLKTGALVWKWQNSGSRMYSAAANFPVEAYGKIFITTPERATRALDKETGREIWFSKAPNGRESQGLSLDGKTLYVKTMLTNELAGVDTQADTCLIRWRCPLPNDADMDLAPAEILSNGNAIFVPSSVGKVYAVAADGSRVLWARKLSNTVINHILPLSEDTVVVSTMDGIVACLKYTDR